MGNAQSQQLSGEENQHGQSCYSACFSRMLPAQMEKKKALQQQQALMKSERETSMNEDHNVAFERKNVENPLNSARSSIAAENGPIVSSPITSPLSQTPAIPIIGKVTEEDERLPPALEGATPLKIPHTQPPPPNIPPPPPFCQHTLPSARSPTTDPHTLSTTTLSRSPPANKLPHTQSPHTLHCNPSSQTLPRSPSANTHVSNKAVGISSVQASVENEHIEAYKAKDHDIPNKAMMVTTMGTCVEYEDAEKYFCKPTSVGIRNIDESCESIFSNAGSCTQSSASEQPIIYAQCSTYQSRNAQDLDVHTANSAPQCHSRSSSVSRNGSRLPVNISALRAALDSTSDFLSNNFGQQTSTQNQETNICNLQKTNPIENCTHQAESIIPLRQFLESTLDSQNSTPEPQTHLTDPLNKNSHLFINLSHPLETVSALRAFLDNIPAHEDSESELNEDQQEGDNAQSSSTLLTEDPAWISSSDWQFQAMSTSVTLSDTSSSIETDDDYSECEDEIEGSLIEQHEGEDPENPQNTSTDESCVDIVPIVTLQHNWEGSPLSRTSVLVMVTDYETNFIQSSCTLPLSLHIPVPLSTPSPYRTPPHDSDHQEHCAEMVCHSESCDTTTNREASSHHLVSPTA